MRVRTEPKFLKCCWEKFLVNIVANPLTAITGRSIEVFRGEEMEQLALSLLREAVALTGAIVRLGREQGIATPMNGVIRTLLEAISMRH